MNKKISSVIIYCSIIILVECFAGYSVEQKNFSIKNIDKKDTTSVSVQSNKSSVESVFYRNIDILETREDIALNLNKYILDVSAESSFADDNILLKGKILFEEQKYDNAIEYFNSAVKNNYIKKKEMRDLINFYIGISYFKIGKSENAVDYINRIQKLEYIKNAALVLLYFNSGNYQKSKENILQFLKLKRNNQYWKFYPSIYIIDTYINYVNGNFSDVIKKYKNYSAEISSTADNKLFLYLFKMYAQSCINQQKYDLFLKELANLHNIDGYIKYYKALINIKLLNFDKSEYLLNLITEFEKKDSEVVNLSYFRLGQINLIKEKYNQAISNFDKIKIVNKELETERNAALGFAYFKIKEFDKSKAYFDKIEISKENNYYFQKYLSDKIKVLFESKNYDDIIKIFENYDMNELKNSIIINDVYFYIVSLSKTGKHSKIIDFYHKLREINYSVDSLFEISKTLEKMENFKESLEILNSIFYKTKDINSRKIIKEKIGDCYAKMGDKIKALKLYDELGSSQKNILLKKAYIYFELKQYKLALVALEGIENRKDDSIKNNIQLLKYNIYLSSGQSDKAEETLQKLLKMNFNIKSYYNILCLHYKNNNLNKFQDIFYKYRKFFYSEKLYKEILNMYCDLLIKNKQHYEALKIFSELEKIDSENIYNIKINKANCSRELGLFMKSKETLEDLIAAKNLTDRQIEEVNYNIALVYYHIGNLEKSFEYLKNIKKYFKDYKLLTLGDINFAIKNYSDAQKYYLQIIDEFKNSKIRDLSLYRLAILNIRNNDFNKSEKYLKTIIEQYNDSIYYKKSLLLLGYYYFQFRRYDESLKCLLNLSSSAPAEYEIDLLNLLSKVYYNLNEFQNVLKINNQIEKKVDEFYKKNVLFNNAEVLCIMKRYDESIKLLNKLLKDDPINKEKYYGLLADNYIFKNDYATAKKYYNIIKDKDSPSIRLLKCDIDYFTDKNIKSFNIDNINTNSLSYIDKLKFLFYNNLNIFYKQKPKNKKEFFLEFNKLDKTGLFKDKLEKMCE